MVPSGNRIASHLRLMMTFYLLQISHSRAQRIYKFDIQLFLLTSSQHSKFSVLSPIFAETIPSFQVLMYVVKSY